MYQTQNIDNLIETNALVEQHIHGGFGIDFANCSTDDFIEFAMKILRKGVGVFYPTLATDSIENLNYQIKRIKSAIDIQAKDKTPMAKIAGIHLEACFLNPEKKGIHDSSNLLLPTIENYKLLEDDSIKIVTIAPELDENFDLSKYLNSKGIRVSAGHCLGTDLSHSQQVTHLYNAMGEFSHRHDSTVNEALSNDNIFIELIADFKHVCTEVLKITFRTKPNNKIILISDALPITDSNMELMEFCGKTIFCKDGIACDCNGTMAGSTDFLADIIKKLVQSGLLDLQTAVAMASTNINYLDKPDIKIFWDSEINVSAISYQGNMLI